MSVDNYTVLPTVVGQFVIRLPSGDVTLKMTEQEMRDYVAGKCRIVDGRIVYS